MERRLTDREIAQQVAAMVAWSLGPLALTTAARPDKPGPPWYRRWWVWVAAGAVVAAATAGVVYAAMPGDDFTFRLKTSGR